ncbi:MAG: 3'-5' exonuclease [Candidatus Dojkabacteria bacterium]|nr:MAG: 3'-5' exonuclease [Candidatus Dojkabacteria bacterium]
MIIVDVEATGLNVTECSLLSIGAICLEEPEKTFYGECRIWEGAIINEEVPEITGFSIEAMQDPNKPTVKELLGKYIEWTQQFEDRTHGGSSVGFDAFLLENEAQRWGFGTPFSYRVVDLHALAYVKYLKLNGKPYVVDGKSKLGLRGTLEFVGMEDNRKIHNALEDAKLTAEAMSRIIYGQNLLPEYKQYDIPDFLKD